MMENSSSKSEYNPEVRIVLDKLFNLFYKKFNEKDKAWDYFIEFLAADNSLEIALQLEHKFEWFINDKRFRDSIFAIYDSKLLKSDYHDHLGDIYFEIQIILNSCIAPGRAYSVVFP